MKQWNAILVLTAALSLAGCSSNPTTQDVGTLEPQVIDIGPEVVQGTLASEKSNESKKYAASLPVAAQRGITSRELQVGGNLTLNDGAYIYAEKGYKFAAKTVTLNDNRVQAALGVRTCVDNSGNNLCVGGAPKEQIRPLKTVLAPDIKALRSTLEPTSFNLTIQGNLNVKTSAQWATLIAQKPVRITGDLKVDVPAILDTASIVVGGEIKLKAGASLKDSRLIGKEIDISGGLSLSGASTILASEKVGITGDYTGSAGASAKTLAQVIAGEGIKLKGSGTGTLSAALWAGGEVDLGGQNNLFGGVLASDSIKITGSTKIGILNPASALLENLGGPGLQALLDGPDQNAAVDTLNEYGINYSPASTGLRAQANTTATTDVELYCGKRFDKTLFKTYKSPASGGKFYIDDVGRPGNVVFTATATAGPVDADCRATVGTYGSGTSAAYQGGHMFGNQLGGYTKRLNLVPQDSNFNTGNWRVAETSVKGCATNGKVASVTVTVAYIGTTTDTPSTFTMAVTVGGTSISRTFDNATSGGPSGLTFQQDITAFVRGKGC